MGTLQLSVNEEFNGAVWRLEIDEVSETLFVETRNEAEKQVSFSSICLKSGKTWFMGLVTPERWLTGIEIAFNGVLLLHNYQSANGPLHKGLVAIDGVTGDTLWSNYIYAFDHLTINGPVVYDTHIHPKKLFLADVKTGATTRIYEPFVYPEVKSNIVSPQIVTPEFLPTKLLPAAPYGNSAHYAEYNNFRIVSLHTLQSGQLKQYLYITDGMDKVFEDLLSTGIHKLQPEAFILHKNRLIYIKNKSQLIVINL
jgi:hypothetical protein